jgi:hypothetical protein
MFLSRKSLTLYNNSYGLHPLGGKRGAGAAVPAGAQGVLAPIPFPKSPGRMATQFLWVIEQPRLICYYLHSMS